jgi:hypothetical protein
MKEIKVGDMVRYPIQRSNAGKVAKMYCRAIVIGQKGKGRKDRLIKILDCDEPIWAMDKSLERIETQRN